MWTTFAENTGNSSFSNNYLVTNRRILLDVGADVRRLYIFGAYRVIPFKSAPAYLLSNRFDWV